MKICDRCFYKDGKPVQAVCEAVLSHTDERFDLCNTCIENLTEFIKKPPIIEENDLKCPYCEFISKSESGLKTHITVKHPDVVF